MKRSTCTQCHRPQVACYCHTLIYIKNRWPIHILQHPNESKHAIGTARIAQLSLDNCRTHLALANNFAENGELKQLIANTNPLLIYPGEESIPIEKINKLETRSLIFLDGSWRKTRRMIYEIPELQFLPTISFTPTSPSRYRIRKEPNENSISTLEAIVTVLSELENDHRKYLPLLKTMDQMIDKQIEFIGKEKYEKNYAQRNLLKNSKKS